MLKPVANFLGSTLTACLCDDLADESQYLSRLVRGLTLLGKWSRVTGEVLCRTRVHRPGRMSIKEEDATH